MLPKIMYVSQGDMPEEHINHVKGMLDAGVRLIQLRMKDVSLLAYASTAYQVRTICNDYQAKLIVNDSFECAQYARADGLHLGLKDMDVNKARRKFSSGCIGGTANTYEHVQQRVKEQVDYIGLGPYRFTSTKKKLDPLLGQDGFRSIMDKMNSMGWKTPVYAIGGIEEEDIETLKQSGVYGIAVSGLLHKTRDKMKTIERINEVLNHA
jgi:thiamine-phosphate pyrophosphorylase